jgi:hypothetical protein
MDRAYHSFKIENPTEEPWWRVVCMRKQYKSKYNIKPGDENLPWRKVTYSNGDNNNKVEKKIESDEAPKNIFKTTIKKERVRFTRITNDQGISRRVNVKRENDIVEDKYHEFDTTKLESMAQHFDVHYRNDEPNEVDVIVSDKEIMKANIWGGIKETGIFIKTKKGTDSEIERDIEKIGCLDEKMSEIIHENTRLKDDIILLKGQMDRYKKQYEDLRELSLNELKIVRSNQQIELDGLRDEIKIYDDELNKLKSSIKSNISVKDVIIKYSEIQRKLNIMKPIVIKIMKYFDKDEFDIEKSITESGFVMTLPKIIDYLISVIRATDGYENEY